MYVARILLRQVYSMTTKSERQQAILAIVRERPVGTQGELQRLLRARGHDVNQATLSRDIRELGLVKAPAGDGATRYAPVEAVSPVVHADSIALVSRMVKGAEAAGNLVVVKTDPGNANAVGIAIDRLRWPEILGTVAGDDTLFVVVREGARPGGIAKRILNLRGT
jgi:transcriptional regulator of arginine metabolism